MKARGLKRTFKLTPEQRAQIEKRIEELRSAPHYQAALRACEDSRRITAEDLMITILPVRDVPVPVRWKGGLVVRSNPKEK